MTWPESVVIVGVVWAFVAVMGVVVWVIFHD